MVIAQQALDEVGALSVWLETLLYGMYTILFFQYVYVIWKKHMSKKSRPIRVFLIVSTTMWICATLHIALNVYRLLRGYVWLRNTVGPENYFLDLGRWDNIAHDALNALVTWFGDFLIIYRCFLVWENNYYVIILPTILLLISIVSNIIALHLFTLVPLGTIFSPTLVHWMNTIYAVALIQNTLTTGLVAYRLWCQEMSTRAVGFLSSKSERSSLMPIVWIIIESAAIYVLELIVLLILYSLKHNAQFIVQEAVVPTVGIVFTLMTIRFAMRTNKHLMTTRLIRDVNEETIEWATASRPNHGQQHDCDISLSDRLGVDTTNTKHGLSSNTFQLETPISENESDIKFAENLGAKDMETDNGAGP